MKNFWDDRYSTKDYAYGLHPNHFFEQQLSAISIGKLLLPAEGEGRNAVFAAKLGWNVIAYDSSKEGQKKASELALAKKVSIDYQVADHNTFKSQENMFDCISLIFAHSLPEIRIPLHKKLVNYLKPGGTLLLEGFSKKQIGRNSGGPKNIDMLFSIDELKNDFVGLSHLNIDEVDSTLDEGKFHSGVASLIQLIGVK